MTAALSSAALRAKQDRLRIDLASKEQHLRDMPSQMEDAALADALGEPFEGPRYTAADVAEVQASVTGRRAALHALSAKIVEAEASEERARADQRVAQGQHVRDTIIPPLRAAAEQAGEQFGAALARLAAAEDKLFNRLQRNLPERNVGGDATTTLMAMVRAPSSTFFDAGAGRGPWDVAAYAQMSVELDDILREMAA